MWVCACIVYTSHSPSLCRFASLYLPVCLAPLSLGSPAVGYSDRYRNLEAKWKGETEKKKKKKKKKKKNFLIKKILFYKKFFIFFFFFFAPKSKAPVGGPSVCLS